MTYAVQGPSGAAPLPEQAVMLSGLLHEALTRGKPARIYFIVASNQPMVDRLAASLSRDRGWNARLGQPRRGRLGPYLTLVMARDGIAQPFANAFAAQGYRLTPSTASRVVIDERAGSSSERLPVTISELGFDAVRR